MTGPAKLSGWQEGERGTSHYFRPGERTSTCGHAFRVDGSRVDREPMTVACLTCHRRRLVPPRPKQPVQTEMFRGLDLMTGRQAS